MPVWSPSPEGKEVLEREDIDSLMARALSWSDGRRFERDGGVEVRVAAAKRVDNAR